MPTNNIDDAFNECYTDFKESKEEEKRMNEQKMEDIKDTALKLNEIRVCHPEDYFYLKGWIHCLLKKENEKKPQEHQLRSDDSGRFFS